MIAFLVPILIVAILAIVTLGISFYCVELVVRLIGRALITQVAETPEPVRVQTATTAVTGPLHSLRA